MITSLQHNGQYNRRKKIKDELEELGIYDIDFIEPNYKGDIRGIKLSSRSLGIVDYLKNNAVSNYIILDDEYSNEYKLLCLNYYKTRIFRGLIYKDLNRIKLKPVNFNQFKYIKYQYKEFGEYIVVTNNLIKVLKKVLKKKCKSNF